MCEVAVAGKLGLLARKDPCTQRTVLYIKISQSL